MQLCCQLSHLQIVDSHLEKDLLYAINLNHAFAIVLFGEQSERVEHVSLIKLGVALKRENSKKLIKGKHWLLCEKFIEFSLLLIVGGEANHFEDLVEALLVDLLIRVCVQIEDLAEVALVGPTNASPRRPGSHSN